MPKFAWPENITEERGEQIAAIVWTIYEYGPIENDEGRATSVLMSHLAQRRVQISPGWLNKTLIELEDGGSLGHFIDREVNGKRTYGISCVRKPGRDPFPPDPRRPTTKKATRAAAEPEPDEEEIEVGETENVEEVGEIETLDPAPGVELDLAPAPSRVDRYLYMVSLLNEMITEEVTAPERRFEEQIGERLTAVNAILEENIRLKKANEALREDKRKLAQALEQSNLIMRDRAARTPNGSREAVTASA